MKRVGNVVGGSILDDALAELEATRKAHPGKPRSGPQEPPGRASEAGGKVRSLERARAAQRVAEATQLQALARKAGLSSQDAQNLADALRAQAPSEWTFVMLSPSQNAAVVRWIMDHSKRRNDAVKLWVRLFEVMRNDNGQIMQSREELAAHLGISPDHVSRIMSELETINAIRRERNGRGVRYFMNSTVATHLPATARKAAQEADGPLLRVMQGGRGE